MTSRTSDHPETLVAAHNLALRLAELGEHEQARTLAEDALTRRRVLGDDHPDTGLSEALLRWLDEQAEEGP